MDNVNQESHVTSTNDETGIKPSPDAIRSTREVYHIPSVHPHLYPPSTSGPHPPRAPEYQTLHLNVFQHSPVLLQAPDRARRSDRPSQASVVYVQALYTQTSRQRHHRTRGRANSVSHPGMGSANCNCIAWGM